MGNELQTQRYLVFRADGETDTVNATSAEFVEIMYEDLGIEVYMIQHI